MRARVQWWERGWVDQRVRNSVHVSWLAALALGARAPPNAAATRISSNVWPHVCRSRAGGENRLFTKQVLHQDAYSTQVIYC